MLLYITNVLVTLKLIETLALRNFTVIADASMLESLSDLNCFSGGGLSQASVVFEECWFVGVPCSKPLGGSKVDSAFHLSEVDK